MPTIGTLLASPNANFNFNRAYVHAFAVRASGWPVSWDGELLSISVGNPLIYTNFIRFEPIFSEWSSNVYSIGWMVKELFYMVPGGTPSPATWGVNWFPDTPIDKPIAFELDPIATGLPYTWISLPPAPPDYWAG